MTIVTFGVKELVGLFRGKRIEVMNNPRKECSNSRMYKVDEKGLWELMFGNDYVILESKELIIEPVKEVNYSGTVLEFDINELDDKLRNKKIIISENAGNLCHVLLYRVNASGIWSVRTGDDFGPASSWMSVKAKNKPGNVCEVCSDYGTKEGESGCRGWTKGFEECHIQDYPGQYKWF